MGVAANPEFVRIELGYNVMDIQDDLGALGNR